MNAFEQFITALSWQFIDGNGQPYNGVQPYGAFHLAFFAAGLLLAALMCIFLKDVRERTMRIILLSVGGFMVVLEIYKQLVMSFGNGVWSYNWSAFPFQFCATPMYAMLLAGLLKGGRLRDGLLAYLSTFNLAAGVCVFIFVGDVFSTSLIGVCVQTSVYHGLMIAVGAWLMRWNRRRGATMQNWIWALVAFFGFEAIALSLNFTINTLVGAGTVDLYFIAYGGTSPIPVVGVLRENLPYFAYLAIYNVGFVVGSTCVYALSLKRRRAVILKRPS